MTKLDESFVAAALEKHPEAAYYINTLAEKVRRLEHLGSTVEAIRELIRVEEIAHPSSIATRHAVCEIMNAFNIWDAGSPNPTESEEGKP